MTEGDQELVDEHQAGHGPREILVEWANNQDRWVRELVAEVLATGQIPSQTAVATIYEHFLIEKGLQEGELPTDRVLTAPTEEVQGEDSLVLTRLHDLNGVNALASSGDIRFNAGLTILFGENATGKTGYARVLKRVAGVRTNEPILGNVHKPVGSGGPSATLEYTLGEAAQILNWNDEVGVSPLTRISVFDSRAVSLHVDDELNYVFTPADLALFREVTNGIRAVQDLATAQRAKVHPGPNQFVSRLQRSATAYPIVESLGATTDVAELEALADVPSDAEQQRETLQGEIAALKGTALDEQIVAVQQRLGALRQVLHVLTEIEQWNAEAYEVARSALTDARRDHERARKEMLDPSELPGPADDQWETFVSAADHYRDHLGLADYPKAGDRCLYCRQSLDAQAASTVQKYRDFLDDTLTRRVGAAEESLRRQMFLPSSPARASAQLFLESQDRGSPAPAWLSGAKVGIEASESIESRTAKGEIVPADTVPKGLSTVCYQVRAETEQLDMHLASLQERVADRTAALASRQTKLADLDARMEVQRQLPAMKQFVAASKQAQRIDGFSRRISSTTLKSLTEASKLASEELVNRDFSKHFHDEMIRLRGPDVALEFQGRSGQSERRKSVASAHRPSAVLSEGECKVLALADFLAESKLRGSTSPVVLDDPVTSLDYRRMQEVADRIAALADDHQVVVFTHNIWLTTELLARFEKRKDECTYYTIREGDTEKGFVSAESGPRQDSPAKLMKRIKQLLQDAKSASPTVQEALAEKGYELVRSWCEAFVEQELLQGVTQRYQPNVMMTKLSAIKGAEIAPIAAQIDPIFDKACRYMGGHSQPIEQLNVRPSIDELQKDAETLVQLRERFLKA